MSLRLSPSYGAEVLVLAYSDIDSRHTKSGAWAAAWGTDFAGPDLSQVVVCRRPDEPNVLLLGLNDSSSVVFDSAHLTVEEAKAYAEQEYPQLSYTWKAP